MRPRGITPIEPSQVTNHVQLLDDMLKLLYMHDHIEVTGSSTIYQNALVKIRNDGFVISVNENSNHIGYKLTFDGVFFYQQGGYQEQQRQLKARANRDRRISNIAVVGSLAAIVLSLLEVLNFLGLQD